MDFTVIDRVYLTEMADDVVLIGCSYQTDLRPAVYG